MVKSKWRGHNILFYNEAWYYTEDNVLVSEDPKRKCKYCGLDNRPDDDHDPCLGELPGVRNACCGHGNINEAYIEFSDRTIIRGKDTIEALKRLKEEF